MRSALTVLLVGAVVLLWLWFGKTGQGPSNVEKQVEGLHRAEEGLVAPQMEQVAQAIRQFYLMKNRYPEDLQELVPQYLGASSIQDPWGNPLLLHPRDAGVTLRCTGRDGQAQTQDDRTMVVQ